MDIYTVQADLGTLGIPALHGAGPAHPAVLGIAGVGAEVVGQTGRLWPAAGVGIGALGAVSGYPVEAIAVDELRVLGGNGCWIEKRKEEEDGDQGGRQGTCAESSGKGYDLHDW